MIDPTRPWAALDQPALYVTRDRRGSDGWRVDPSAVRRGLRLVAERGGAPAAVKAWWGWTAPKLTDRERAHVEQALVRWWAARSTGPAVLASLPEALLDAWAELSDEEQATTLGSLIAPDRGWCRGRIGGWVVYHGLWAVVMCAADARAWRARRMAAERARRRAYARRARGE